MKLSTCAHGLTTRLIVFSGGRMTRLLSLALLSALLPGFALACACGCGVFDVGTAAMILTHPGGMLYLEDDYQDQDQNWVGSHAAPAANNTDKEIETHFAGIGFDYNFDRDWGMSVKLPYWFRAFRTDIGVPGAPDIQTYRHDALGDVRVLGTYTGFSPDMSTGLSVGMKLPTGDWTYPNFDRDTSIGTGTTDLLLGGYHLGTVSVENHLKWFVEALFQRAFDAREGYRPGNETDAAAGLLYDGFQLGNNNSLTALLQLIGSDRLHDSGVNADPPNSGYHRVLLSPGFEADVGKWKLYADAEFRVYHYANAAPSVAAEGTQGQLVAPVLLKLIVSYSF
ncbi:MAG: hypothetical protein ABSF86_21770 [Steroidobacteraceae bacterium]